MLTETEALRPWWSKLLYWRPGYVPRHSTPKWADKHAISAIYAECRATSVRTGIKHTVDHVVPLRGTIVCGLHVENNLQIITDAKNRQKNNSFDDVPRGRVHRVSDWV